MLTYVGKAIGSKEEGAFTMKLGQRYSDKFNTFLKAFSYVLRPVHTILLSFNRKSMRKFIDLGKTIFGCFYSVFDHVHSFDEAKMAETARNKRVLLIHKCLMKY